MKEILISERDASQRLDKYLMKYMDKAPKGFVYKMLRKKRIKLNGGRAEGSELLAPGDRLQLYLSEETMDSFMGLKTPDPLPRTFGIVYEDAHVLAADKPQGLLSHGDGGEEDTLLGQILYYLYEKGDYVPAKDSTFTPALCNRLDRNTGGLVLAGKDFASVQTLNNLIKERKIDKLYLTAVKGELTAPGKLTGYVLREEATGETRVLDSPVEGARPVALTYTPLKTKGGFTLLEVNLLTGRTHQIRAQLSAAGYPIIGDPKYGESGINARFRREFGLTMQFLYAFRLTFHTADTPLAYLDGKSLTADLPPVLSQIRRTYFS